MSNKTATTIESCIIEILQLQEKPNEEIAKLNAVIRKAQIKKDELKRKNDVIIDKTCKKYQVKSYHIKTILKA